MELLVKIDYYFYQVNLPNSNLTVPHVFLLWLDDMIWLVA